MILRPHLDELITKLKEAKKQGIDIVLCTTAKNEWVERFLTLKPEFRTLFNRMLTRDNENEWKDFKAEQNPVEYEVGQIDYNAVNSKPVTTFGYDSIVFIDNSSTEYQRLKRLFEIAQGKLEKDVTYFSGFGFNGEGIGMQHILVCRKASDQNPEINQNLEKYLEHERNDPGCQMMCSVITVRGINTDSPKYTSEIRESSKVRRRL